MRKIKIGVFGLSRGATQSVSILQNEGEIVAVCDKNARRCEAAKAKYGDIGV